MDKPTWWNAGDWGEGQKRYQKEARTLNLTLSAQCLKETDWDSLSIRAAMFVHQR